MRGLLFHGISFGLMAVMGVLGLAGPIWRRDWCRAWLKLYARAVIRLAGAVFGLRVEISGEVPRGDVLIAAKHQSLLDVYLLYATLPEPRFVMKRALLWMPVFGLYTWRAGMVPIDRRVRYGGAEGMVAALASASGQIVIYPQGTRVAPGEHVPYRRGIARLAEATGWAVVPAATNAGLFWSRGGAVRGPGMVRLRFLEPLPGGLPRGQLMAHLEERIEA
ncbi:MAG: lysophospholipid acyltransferase family protein, partial [Pseudomonadota bacterium]